MFKGANINPFKSKAWLASPIIHGEEIKYIQETYDTNWCLQLEKTQMGLKRLQLRKLKSSMVLVFLVVLQYCIFVKRAWERLYGKPAISHGALEDKRVFCPDMTFDAALNTVVYEDGISIFIDT